MVVALPRRLRQVHLTAAGVGRSGEGVEGKLPAVFVVRVVDVVNGLGEQWVLDGRGSVAEVFGVFDWLEEELLLELRRLGDQGLPLLFDYALAIMDRLNW